MLNWENGNLRGKIRIILPVIMLISGIAVFLVSVYGSGFSTGLKAGVVLTYKNLTVLCINNSLP